MPDNEFPMESFRPIGHTAAGRVINLCARPHLPPATPWSVEYASVEITFDSVEIDTRLEGDGAKLRELMALYRMTVTRMKQMRD